MQARITSLGIREERYPEGRTGPERFKTNLSGLAGRLATVAMSPESSSRKEAASQSAPIGHIFGHAIDFLGEMRVYAGFESRRPDHTNPRKFQSTKT